MSDHRILAGAIAGARHKRSQTGRTAFATTEEPTEQEPKTLISRLSFISPNVTREEAE